MIKKIWLLMIVFASGCMVIPTETVEEQDREPNHVPINVSDVVDAIPKYEKRTRAGNPVEYEVLGKKYRVLAESKGYKQRGIASWYGEKFHGRKTSNGETYNMYAMTAAHKTLPIPSYVRVTHLKNQRSVVLRVNDRGPFHEGRIIDLSYTAAVKLGIKQTGTGQVEVTAIEFDAIEKQVLAPQTVEEKVAKNYLSEQQISTYFLQVGAFSNQVNAKQLQDRLVLGQIVKSRIKMSENQPISVYRVQVGPLISSYQVEEYSNKLAALGFSQIQLIVEN